MKKKSNTRIHSGSCLCGAVKFSFVGKLDDIWFCHCHACRKNYGMYGAFAGVKRGALKLEHSLPLGKTKVPGGADRYFCSGCGSPILWDKKAMPCTYVLLGLIDGAAEIEHAQHIYTREKGAYYEICDHWKQYKTVPR